ncbi:hypothetical protein LTR70_004877 [Exophiala xenobiotica]|uniref:Uncharacterized protein n=1 Tax=Lithohypha guttulata TaxID=1690604 RepID=A0ABR0KCA7_9EURO|nr:hypothetical protein LTR24_004495 [Lithohypha guttulata]KAK5319832.1 hypothetical protein LTR70_004877 [Exophiala xenobiotica]
MSLMQRPFTSTADYYTTPEVTGSEDDGSTATQRLSSALDTQRLQEEVKVLKDELELLKIQQTVERRWTDLYKKLDELHQHIGMPRASVSIQGSKVPICRLCYAILTLAHQRPLQERQDFADRLSNIFITKHGHELTDLEPQWQYLNSIYEAYYDFRTVANRGPYWHLEYGLPVEEVVIPVTRPTPEPYTIWMCLPAVSYGKEVPFMVKARASLLRNGLQG